MNAYVDPDLCIGCTQCAGLCPAVFHMEGVLAVAEPGSIPPEEVPQAVDAANAFPVYWSLTATASPTVPFSASSC